MFNVTFTVDGLELVCNTRAFLSRSKFLRKEVYSLERCLDAPKWSTVRRIWGNEHSLLFFIPSLLEASSQLSGFLTWIDTER